MRLDHSQEVLNLDGTPLRQNDQVLTFKDLAIHALGMENPQEQLGAEKKARCYQTTLKFLRGNKVKLTVEEAALIKERAGVTLGTLVYGRLCDWIEGKEPVVESDEGDDEDVVKSDGDDPEG